MKSSLRNKKIERYQSQQSQQDPQQILNQFLNSQQWSTLPQFLRLTVKSLQKCLNQNSFKINQQILALDQLSIKSNQLQVTQLSKVSKKDITAIIQQQVKKTFHQNKQYWTAYQKSDSDSLLQRQQGLDKLMIQEVKTIVDQMIKSNQKFLLQKIQKTQKQEIQSYFQKQNEQLTRVMADMQSFSARIILFQQNNQEIAIYHRKLQHRLMIIQQDLNRQANQFLDHIRRDTIQKMYNSHNVSPNINTNIKNKSHQNSIHTQLQQKKQFDSLKKEISILQQKIILSKKEFVDTKQFSDFKMKINKELTDLIKFQKFQQLFNKFQLQFMDKLTSLSKQITILDKKIDSKPKIQTYNEPSNIYYDRSLENSEVKKTKRQKSKSVSKRRKMSNKNQQQQEKHSNPSKSVKQITSTLHRLEKALQQKENKYLKQFQKLVHHQIQIQKGYIQQEIEKRQKKICLFVQKQLKILQVDMPLKENKNDLKKTVQMLAQNMIHCRYIYTGQKQLKGLIIWEKQCVNLMQQNFKWRQKQPYVLVQAKGLYKIQSGVYGQKNVQCYVQLNGQPVGYLKGNDIPQNCKSKSRGYVFSEAMILPGHVKVSLKVQKSFYGQAYIQIYRL